MKLNFSNDTYERLLDEANDNEIAIATLVNRIVMDHYSDKIPNKHIKVYNDEKFDKKVNKKARKRSF